MRPLLLLVALACACGDDDESIDAGADARVDANVPDTPSDATDAPDAPEGCLVTSASAWGLEIADDVSVGFRASLTPPTEGDRLVVLFERRSPEPDIGTFVLGPSGPDGNFGDCSHCVHIPIAPDRAFFADRGTLVTRADPYAQIFDATLSNVRLIEVEVDPFTRASTPIEGGACVELADTSVTGRFPPEGWSCDDDDWADGVGCHCECGAFDPDCNAIDDCPPFDPECMPTEPLPLVNCPEGRICGFDPITFGDRCTETCGWLARSSCSEDGTCVFDFGPETSDTCFTADDPRLDGATIGEDCLVSGLQKVCAIEGGFALGYCEPSGRCRPVCDDDAQCTEEGETCQRFVGPDGLGFCGAPFTDG